LCDLLAGFEGEEVRDMLSARITTSIRQFMDFGSVDTTFIGEEEKPVVSGCDKEVFDYIILS
jgi:hypothetical protein